MHKYNDVGSFKSQEDGRTDGHLAVVPWLQEIPDGHVSDVTELADMIGVEKLVLIGWIRTDLDFARLVATKIAAENSDIVRLLLTSEAGELTPQLLVQLTQ